MKNKVHKPLISANLVNNDTEINNNTITDLGFSLNSRRKFPYQFSKKKHK